MPTRVPTREEKHKGVGVLTIKRFGRGKKNKRKRKENNFRGNIKEAMTKHNKERAQARAYFKVNKA